MDVKWTMAYAEFRKKLTNHEIDNLRATLKNLKLFGRLTEGYHILEMEGPRRFVAYAFVFRALQVWLLDGHFVRKGEPRAVAKKRLEQWVEDFGAGKTPAEAS